MAHRAKSTIVGGDKRMLWAGLLIALLFWVFEASIHGIVFEHEPIAGHLVPTSPHEVWSRSIVCLLFIAFGAFAHVAVVRAHRAREEQQKLQGRLEEVLMKALSGFLPICANCKKIRLEDTDPERQSSWHPVESYLNRRTGVEITHSICPACERELYWERVEEPSDGYEI
jgi:hypothetical protein